MRENYQIAIKTGGGDALVVHTGIVKISVEGYLYCSFMNKWVYPDHLTIFTSFDICATSQQKKTDLKAMMCSYEQIATI